jgi:hypothetical protein
MKPVKTGSDVDEVTRKAIETLFGPQYQGLKVREMLPYISDQLVVKSGHPRYRFFLREHNILLIFLLWRSMVGLLVLA